MSSNSDLRSMIREMVESIVRETVTETVQDVIGGAMERTAAPRIVRPADTFREASERRQQPEPERERERRPIGARTEYVLNGRPSEQRIADLRGNDRRAYQYIVRHNPTTADKVEAGTGLKRKAVESSVYSLRKQNLIKSRPIA